MNDLVALEDVSWRRFRAAVGRLTPQQLESTTTAGWTAKEMIGHLAFWSEATEPVIVEMFRGQPLRRDFAFGSGYESDPEEPWPIADVHNAREAAWATPRPASEVIARLDAGHARFVDLLESLTPEELEDERYRTYVANTCTEFDAHLKELLALLDDS